MPSSGSISSPASGAIARAAASASGAGGTSPSSACRKPSTSGISRGSTENAPEPLDERCRLDERVVGDPRHRRVTAAPVHAQHERRAHLLGGRAEVEHLAAELDAVARALVDREVRADRIRMSLDEPLQAEAVADLLVGGGDEDQVARRRASLRARASPARRRSPRPRPSCRARRAPTPRRRRARHRTARAATRARRRARRRCARAARATGRRRGPGCARRGSRAPARCAYSSHSTPAASR